MSTKTLPTLIYIEYIENKDVNLYPKKLIAPGETISVIGYFKKLTLTEPASCSYTSEMTDNGRIYTTTISGVMIDDDSQAMQHRLQTKHHLYKITDVYRSMYLIGTDKKPFPEIIFSPEIEGSPAGKRAVPFEIKWVSTLPPTLIVDL